ncbi:hypothetical protein PROFUN_06803 [Planoprotostelium fungivorum]|uniref:Uncharacterized protein n=1 Tax=Planoprotostelium fungivorum TaxID=1890364 RepID=A0A2P6NNN9_9EUKA|nr:hypothetical protein PROFUN_06803 [Planoprotostelium fungivorum]
MDALADSKKYNKWTFQLQNRKHDHQKRREQNKQIFGKRYKEIEKGNKEADRLARHVLRRYRSHLLRASSLAILADGRSPTLTFLVSRKNMSKSLNVRLSCVVLTFQSSQRRNFSLKAGTVSSMTSQEYLSEVPTGLQSSKLSVGQQWPRPAETDLSWRLFRHSLYLDVKTQSRQGGDSSRPFSHNIVRRDRDKTNKSGLGLSDNAIKSGC